MSSNNRKLKTFSTSSISGMVKKHTKRAHSADKASSYNRQAQQSNSELLADSHTATTKPSTVETVPTKEELNKVENRETTAESYKSLSTSTHTSCF